MTVAAMAPAKAGLKAAKGRVKAVAGDAAGVADAVDAASEMTERIDRQANPSQGKMQARCLQHLPQARLRIPAQMPLRRVR